MGALRQDLRYGLRMLVRKPGFTLIAVLTLALGIGANTAIFSVVNAVLLRPLPYKDSERIVTLWQRDAKTGAKDDGAAPANFLDWREQNQSFSELGSALPFSHSLTGQGEPESFRSWRVTEGFFEILGTQPLRGRTLLPEDYRPGGERVIVVGQGLWQRRFGADPSLVGQKLVLNGQPYTVVGVMPAEFQFPPGRELWTPNVMGEQERRVRGSGYIKVVGRLKDGVSVAQAQSEMDAIAARISAEHMGTSKEMGVSVVPLPDQIVGQVRPALLMLLVAVGLVLLIACANVANLLLVRAAERKREFAIRAALGAGRWRLVRQLLTESVALAVLGSVGGVLLATWLVDALLALGPGDLPRVEQIGFDARVLAFALGVTALTALVFGLAPALQFSRPDVQDSLKEGGRTAGFARHRLRDALVVAEVALALMLLVGAGLLMHSFMRLLRVDPGFSADKALTLEVHVWGRQPTGEKRAAFFEQTLDRLAALPGVEAAGAVSALPFHESSIDINTTFNIEGQPVPPAGQEPVAYATVATSDYFKAMGIPLRSGRVHTRFDNLNSAQVAVINETMARRYFGQGEDPVGKKISVTFLGRQTTREIVGVVGDVRHTGLDSDPRPELFFPHAQEPYGSMTYVVRTASEPSAMLAAVKNEIWAVNKDQPFSSVATVEQLVSRSFAQRRFNLLLVGAFAAIALALAGVGIYGLISFTTSQRTHEIGVRVALGAQRRDIFKLIVGQGMVLALAGIGAGLLGAFALTRFLASLLYGVSPTDTVTFVSVSLLLALVALVASYVPARRAMRVDPMVALRYE